MRIKSEYRSYNDLFRGLHSKAEGLSRSLEYFGKWDYQLKMLNMILEQIPLMKDDIVQVIGKIEELTGKIKSKEPTLVEIAALVKEIEIDLGKMKGETIKMAAAAYRNGADKAIDNDKAVINELSEMGFDNLEILRIIREFKDSGVKQVWIPNKKDGCNSLS